MVADALVYHPALAHWLRFVATTGAYIRISRSSRTPQIRSIAYTSP
jgi:hypothetical protein